MRILQFSNCPVIHGSGSGRTRLAWAGRLRDLGHEITTIDSLVLLKGDDGKPAGRRARIAWGAWRWLVRRDLSRYDLIEFYGAEFALATWRLAKRRNRPLLAAHTDGLELLAEERLRAFRVAPAPESVFKRLALGVLMSVKSFLDKKAFTEVDGFVTASGADMEYLRRHGLRTAATMEVVPLGLDPAYLDLPWRSSAREEKVVFLGTWLDRKGIKPVVGVMSALLRERPGLKFDIFGVDEAPVEAVLGNFPEEVRERVAVTPVTSMSAIIAAHLSAKVFFLPSEYEGFGLATAEAMACGCAVVTTPTGLGANLDPGVEGSVCDFGDMAAMKAAILRLLDDEPARLRMAEAGWRRAQSLRWEDSAKRLEATYLGWLEERRRCLAGSSPLPVPGAARENPDR